MKRTIWMAAVIACATTVATAAQSTTGQTAGNSENTITVTGCLQDRSTASGSATTSAMYVLSNAMNGSDRMHRPDSTTATGTTATGTTGTTTGTTGTTSSGAMNSSGRSYVLDGHDSDLKRHIGHRIEVTGTVDKNGSGSARSSATETTTSGSAASMSDGGSQHLMVSSVRMISADCSAR